MCVCDIEGEPDNILELQPFRHCSDCRKGGGGRVQDLADAHWGGDTSSGCCDGRQKWSSRTSKAVCVSESFVENAERRQRDREQWHDTPECGWKMHNGPFIYVYSLVMHLTTISEDVNISVLLLKHSHGVCLHSVPPDSRFGQSWLSVIGRGVWERA